MVVSCPVGAENLTQVLDNGNSAVERAVPPGPTCILKEPFLLLYVQAQIETDPEGSSCRRGERGPRVTNWKKNHGVDERWSGYIWKRAALCF